MAACQRDCFPQRGHCEDNWTLPGCPRLPTPPTPAMLACFPASAVTVHPRRSHHKVLLSDQTHEETHCKLGSFGNVPFCLHSGPVCVGEPVLESLPPLQTLPASLVSFLTALSRSSFSIMKVRARTEHTCPMGQPARPGHRRVLGTRNGDGLTFLPWTWTAPKPRPPGTSVGQLTWGGWQDRGHGWNPEGGLNGLSVL